MHYVALLNGEEREVEISEVAPFTYRITMNGKAHVVDARAITPDSLSLLLDGQAYDIQSEKDPSGKGDNLLVRGHPLNVEMVDLRTLRLRKAVSSGAAADGPRPIKAPMPGKIVAVHVKEGDTVTKDQGLVVIEAMKMENELRAPKDGVIKSIGVSIGQAVENGATLCVVG